MTDKSDVLAKVAQLNVHRPFPQVSLSVQVADRLEGLLTGGDIVVGQKLPTESELCDVFGVSRTVIREAITQLKSLGLVESRRGIGTTVIGTATVDAMPAKQIHPATVEDILHVLELRLSLEPAVAELAAQRHDADDRRALLDRHTAFIRARFGESKARDEDYAFHYAIATAAKNPLFKLFYDHLNQNMIPRGKLMRDEMDTSETDNYLARVEQEHARILEAILGRDPAAARDTMFEHLARASSTYAKYHKANMQPASANQ